MLPSSVRRVVSSGPQAGGLASSSLASSAPRATGAAPGTLLLSRCGHQRRYSSSKPSKSDNGSGEMSSNQSVPASARGSGKASGDKRRRKSERDATKKLPSVPNTHHMVGEGRISPPRHPLADFPVSVLLTRSPALGLSSFFSLHRPISITQTMPKTVTDEQFASIFAPRTRSGKVSDTMSTISSTIDQLEGPMAAMGLEGQQDASHQPNGGMHRMEIRNADGSESSISLQVDAMSGDFLPFHPPPLPLPQVQASTGTEAEGGADAATEEAPQHRSYKAMFTIEENTEPDGQIRIVAHSPRIVQDEQPRSFLERMAQRQLRLDEAQGRRTDMYGISVKRQRKLRMKKKKYKKLMRRTRNLRRKLDRT